MKKVISILGIIFFTMSSAVISFILGTAEVSQLKDDIQDLQELSNEKLNGAIIAQSKYFTATATFEDGQLMSILLLDINGETIYEEVIADNAVGSIYYAADYVSMLMELNELLLKEDLLYEEELTQLIEEDVIEDNTTDSAIVVEPEDETEDEIVDPEADPEATEGEDSSESSE